MNKILLLLFCVVICRVDTWAQSVPSEGAVLNYRLVGFAPFGAKPAKGYKIQVANGYLQSPADFEKNIIRAASVGSGKALMEVPSFGAKYTWRLLPPDKAGSSKTASLHHFSTSVVNDIDDPLHVRLRVTTPSPQKYDDMYVFLDGNRAMYDMKGNLVWFLPDSDGEFRNGVHDMKLSAGGGITLLSNDNAYEIAYDGSRIWEGPNDGRVSGEKKEWYHHELTKLAGGHYMMLGNEFLYNKNFRLGQDTIVSLTDKKDSSADAARMVFGTLIEYDQRGKVVWSWKASDYFRKSDLAAFIPGNELERIALTDMHPNSFFFDEKEKIIYMGFKNISRIVKIKYPEGTVLNEYGEKFRTGTPISGNGLFCNQHACKRSSIGCLFLFNNNGCDRNAAPKIKILEEPKDAGGALKKLWEYDCVADGDYPLAARSGGNVVEMPDSSLFVSVGGAWGKVFIVNRRKQVEWSASAERWSEADQKWIPIPQYRASIITDRKQLEHLVVNHNANVANKQRDAQHIASR